MDISFTYTSIILFAVALLLFRQVKSSKIEIGLVFLLSLISMVLFIIYGASHYFTGFGINDATLYHLSYGLEGAGFIEYAGMIATTISTSVIGCIYLYRLVSSNQHKQRTSHKKSISSYVMLSTSLLMNPAATDIYNLNHFAQDSSGYDKYYLEPNISESQDKNKNLVFIYAESLERTYFDENIFPGLIKGLRDLESSSTYFTNIQQVYSTGWTVAGMTASQCGIPLITPSHGNSMSGMDQFLSSAVCIGDLLNHEGYHLTYMGGADLQFAGKGKLYNSHGFDNVLGEDELIPRLKDDSYLANWGLYDDTLFDMLYQRFIELSEAGEKFGIFTLTLDTHHPKGHPSKSCKNIQYGDGSNPMLNSVACSDYLITNFVERISKTPYAKDTIIVLVSDHLAMRNTASDLLRKGDRKNLFMILDPSDRRSDEIETLGSMLDVGPTILPFIGYDGDIGLGRDLLVEKENEEDRRYIHFNLKRWTGELKKYWDFPRVVDSLEIDIDKGSARIDSREFKIPILIELNENLESTLKFDFGRSGHKSLNDHRLELSDDQNFLSVDECENIASYHSSSMEGELCLIYGKGTEEIEVKRIGGKVTLTANEIRELLGIKRKFIPYRVAHAGGGINGKTYTNSIEALDHNIRNGFQYFEIDFSVTKDGEVVCLHDWGDSFKRSFGYDAGERVTLAEFNNLVKNKSEFNKCTMSSLALWMKENPMAYIITDVKDDNVEVLKIILKSLPNSEKRVIPQVYNPKNHMEIKELGFEKIIWTLYRFSGSDDDVLNWVDMMRGPLAVTMTKGKARAGLAEKLAKRDIPTYVHTVNSAEEEREFINIHGVSNLYTDFLDPY